MCCSRCSIRFKNRRGHLSSVSCTVANEHPTPALLKLCLSRRSVVHRSSLAIDVTSLKCGRRAGSDLTFGVYFYWSSQETEGLRFLFAKGGNARSRPTNTRKKCSVFCSFCSDNALVCSDRLVTLALCGFVYLTTLQKKENAPLLCDLEVTLFLCFGGVCTSITERRYEFKGVRMFNLARLFIPPFFFFLLTFLSCI